VVGKIDGEFRRQLDTEATKLKTSWLERLDPLPVVMDIR